MTRASENFVSECVLRAIADDYDDYEEFEKILHDVIEYATEYGKNISRPATQKALEELIGDGYAQAFKLSADRSPVQPVGYSSSDLEQLWFYVTPSGKKLALELSRNWKQPCAG